MKRIIVVALLLVSATAFPQDGKGRFKVYGEMNNQVTWHSRDGLYDESGLFYLLPVDKSLNDVKMDLNSYTQKLNFVNLASNAGVSWTGWKDGILSLEAKVDGNLYCNTQNGVTFRLRNAYFNADLDFGRAGTLSLLAGQKRHPLAEGVPHTFSINAGAPFNPYSFAPQFKAEYKFLPWLSASVAALWQSYNHSTGPEGWSNQYISNACMPELYAGLDFHLIGITARAGVDYLTIKPRSLATYPYTEVTIPASDKICTLSPFIYLEYQGKNWSIRGKSVLASAGEHLTLMGGYAAHSIDEYGSYDYTPYRSTTSWISGEYRFLGFEVSLMAAYMQNLGTTGSVRSLDTIFYANDLYNILRTARLSPCIKYNYKHLTAGISYECTAAQYGDNNKILKSNGLSAGDVSLVTDHCVTFLLGCRF